VSNILDPGTHREVSYSLNQEDSPPNYKVPSKIPRKPMDQDFDEPIHNIGNFPPTLIATELDIPSMVLSWEPHGRKAAG
jgi:hypothetical protein